MTETEHLFARVADDMAALERELKARCRGEDYWRWVCARLLPDMPREGLSLAQRDALDEALIRLNRAGGGVSSPAEGLRAQDGPPPARPDDDGIDVEERPMTAEEERLFGLAHK